VGIEKHQSHKYSYPLLYSSLCLSIDLSELLLHSISNRNHQRQFIQIHAALL